MKKLFVAVAVLAVPIFIATGAWALTVNDQEGVAGTYYGGILTDITSGSPVQDLTYAHDINPPRVCRTFMSEYDIVAHLEMRSEA